LQERFNPLISSIIVGTVWAFWHLPLFYMTGTSQHELHLPFGGFLAGLCAMSIIMTWLNNRTSGSIWTSIFFHWIYTCIAQVVFTGVTRNDVFNVIEYTPYILIAVIITLCARMWNRTNLPNETAEA